MENIINADGEKREKWKMADGVHVSVRIWDKVEKPVGVVQIIHGMAEHIGRYDDFARFLNANGFIAFGCDLRGHGLTDPSALGLAGSGDIFSRCVSDAREMTARASSLFKLPVVLFGHSYGSLIAQRYIGGGTSAIAGLVLSGSAAMGGLMVKIGYKLAVGKCRKNKADEKGETFANMTFVKYDKKIRDGINGWLSRDVEQVGKYNLDKYCGFVCSNGFYKSLFGGLLSIAEDNGERIDKNLKMLIASGSMDMFGECGKLPNKLNARYVGFGLKPELKIYEGARHEILNEINKGEVYTDLLNFVKKCI